MVASGSPMPYLFSIGVPFYGLVSIGILEIKDRARKSNFGLSLLIDIFATDAYSMVISNLLLVFLYNNHLN